MIDHFLKLGEDRLLQAAGKEVSELCPSLWKLGYAGTQAKHGLGPRAGRTLPTRIPERLRISVADMGRKIAGILIIQRKGVCE